MRWAISYFLSVVQGERKDPEQLLPLQKKIVRCHARRGKKQTVSPDLEMKLGVGGGGGGELPGKKRARVRRGGRMGGVGGGEDLRYTTPSGIVSQPWLWWLVVFLGWSYRPGVQDR